MNRPNPFMPAALVLPHFSPAGPESSERNRLLSVSKTACRIAGGKNRSTTLSCGALVCAGLLAANPLAFAARSDRLDLFPKLQAGQTITYRIAYRVEKQSKTQSSVLMAQAPPVADIYVEGLLRLNILGVEAQGRRATIHALSALQPFSAETKLLPPSAPSRAPAAEDNGSAVEFTISPSGRIDQIKNLDALPPDQQQAWQQWASSFAAAAAFPANGIEVAEKWKSEEPEKAASPIAGLIWNRDSTYLRNEPCRITQTARQADEAGSAHPSETCAVIQITATLKQKSSQKNATPEDFKLHQLHTIGAATGTNSTLLYISLSTGLVIRASDHADQTMHVTIAKSDNSNRVHYDLHAKSNTEIFQVPNTPPTTP